MLDAPSSVRLGLVAALLLRAASTLGGTRRGRTKVQREVDGIYAKLLQLLARRGYRKRDAQTPREFALAVVRSGGADYRPLRRITEDLYAVRFGGRPLDETSRQRIDAFAEELRSASRAEG